VTVTGVESPWAYGGLQVPWEEAEIVLIPVAYDLTTSYGTGTRHGPQALLQASAQMELYDEELGDTPTAVGVHTLAPMEQVASGPREMVERVAAAVGKVLDAGKMPVLIGGDHSVSIGAFRAMAERSVSATIVQLDAHADLRNEYQGSPFSHACVMARARERFDCVQIGIRSGSDLEFERVRRDRLALFTARQLPKIADGNYGQITDLLAPRVYLTIDLDVLDPSIMPATGTPEPGGLQWGEFLAVVRAVTRDRDVIGFDIVELAPIPGLHAPDFAAARLLNKMLGYARSSGGMR
jgi:agmatinase